MSIRTERDNAKARAERMARNWMDEVVKRRRWQRLAVVAIAACPGSFIAGGLLLQRALEWWW